MFVYFAMGFKRPRITCLMV
jgi:hypothetical protein